ncbi:hypothetical protein RND71_038750 [Anisodus tanguticus]|uniref:Diaminopimelate epimerase n=1 Tax=Anisodus tanguticus TaxID=243964 RepID=A0AAE1R199_9SOLA|nr:hypothetical protein RND71_038750 [Anisodus tanguticus]
MRIEASEKGSFLDPKESGILHFVKYHGLGNDFILVDNRDTTEPKVTPDQAVKLCDRNFGIGADGNLFKSSPLHTLKRVSGNVVQRCTVDLPGGPLDIEWSEKDNHIYMTGPAEVVFYGSVPL